VLGKQTVFPILNWRKNIYLQKGKMKNYRIGSFDRVREIFGRLSQKVMSFSYIPSKLRIARKILSIVPGGITVLKDRWGWKYFVHHKSHVGNALLTDMESEASVVKLAMRELTKGKRANIIDVGANAGTFALPLSSRAERMMLVEADPQLAKIMEKTVEYNGLDGIDIVNCAVTSEDAETVTFYRANKLKDLSSLREGYLKGRDEYSELEVEAAKLKEVIEESGFERIDLLKIDIEGMSTEATLSLEKRARVVRTIIAEPDERIEKTVQFLEKKGFSASRPLSGRKDLSTHSRETILFNK